MQTRISARSEARRGGQPDTRWPRAFVSLRHRDFRLLITGLAVATAGYWALIVAQSWLTLRLTDSKLILGIINACLSLPFLVIALPAGVVADRANRQRLMTLTRGGVTALMVALAALTFTDLINLWLLGMIAFAAGCLMALDLPTRQSLAPELVAADEVPNAVAITQLVFTGTTVLGPTVGGLLLNVSGAGGAFLLTAAGNAVLVVMVRQMRFPPRTRRPQRPMVRRDVSEGLGYVLRNPILQPLMVIAVCVATLAQPYQSFLPALAKETLRLDAGGLGLLYAAGGVGAIIGAAVVAMLGEIRHRGRLILLAAVLFGLALVGAALSQALPLTLALLALVGLANAVNSTINQTVMVTLAPEDLRGRIMSVNVLVFGLSPFGNLVLGALADRTSTPTALAAGGLALAVVALLTTLARPRLRAL